MILYNVTVGIDPEIENEWLNWMKTDHIPKVMKTGYFSEYKIFRVLGEQEGDAISYSIQYFAKELNMVMQYLEKDAKPLAEEHKTRFLNRHVAFRTLLQSVEH